MNGLLKREGEKVDFESWFVRKYANSEISVAQAFVFNYETGTYVCPSIQMEYQNYLKGRQK